MAAIFQDGRHNYKMIGKHVLTNDICILDHNTIKNPVLIINFNIFLNGTYLFFFKMAAIFQNGCQSCKK